MYYDFDILGCEQYKRFETVEEFKAYFIKKYGHLASLICISSSYGGISVLFKVRNKITKENFSTIYQTVSETILSGETIDKKSTDIGRAMFISHDPSVFVNYNNEIEVESNVKYVKVVADKKREYQSKTSDQFINTLTSPFSILSLDLVLQKLVLHTEVPVSNLVVDFKPVDFMSFYIPKVIKDGSKHRIYKSMIHTLV